MLEALHRVHDGDIGEGLVSQTADGGQGPAGQLALPIQPIQGGTTQRTLLNISTSSKGLRKSRTLHGGTELIIEESATQIKHEQARPLRLM